ncbi:hypothetical protein VOLCADRAFT_86313 [Volvox carteri f. nagariensis]|uniref:Uncharacterized protein n=1 Tax=Volvox carteri f. nagariensis TaxID=3068 RepID=D8TIF8_VOLCA|nr:uncharacterized protein VOLCADRAFT_86313 [Volvox carteri f. nagariensis]EFJ53233.1 hypothetical protein VOLCADRAFT_86313 [Volvox carteri f. nagariensis]|eukprot:XP_002946238.1 hypothetical protein VOLCADRAFT_86313 [Volvox carteri f. nagariensis]
MLSKAGLQPSLLTYLLRSLGACHLPTGRDGKPFLTYWDYRDLRGYAPTGLGTRIVADKKVTPSTVMYQLRSPILQGDLEIRAWLTERALHDVLKDAAEPMLASWRRPDRSQAQPVASPFDPEAANALLGRLQSGAGRPNADGATLPARRASPQIGSLPAVCSTRQANVELAGQPDNGRVRQHEGLEAAQAPATVDQLAADGGQPSPRPGMPGGNDCGATGANPRAQQGDQRSPEEPGRVPHEQRRPPRHRSPPLYDDDQDLNSSYCHPAAAAALLRTFKDAFARAYQRQKQRIQEEILMARHATLFGAGRDPQAGRQRHEAGGRQPAGADVEDDSFGEGTVRPQAQGFRNSMVAPGAAAGRTQPPHRASAGAAGRSAALAQQEGLGAARTDTVPSGPGRAGLRAGKQQEQGEHREEDMEGEEEEGGGTGHQKHLDGKCLAGKRGAVANGNDDLGRLSDEEAAVQRPQKRRRRMFRRGGAADLAADSDGRDISTPQHAAPPEQQPQAKGAQQAPSPGHTDEIDSPSTPYTSATSAGVTISSTWTPASDAVLQSPAEGDLNDNRAPSGAQGEPRRYHAAIIPDDRAKAAWKKLGEILQAAKTAARYGHPGQAVALPPQKAAVEADPAQKTRPCTLVGVNAELPGGGATLRVNADTSAGKGSGSADGEATQPVGAAPAHGVAAPAGDGVGVEAGLARGQADGERQAGLHAAPAGGAAVPPHSTAALPGGTGGGASASPHARAQLPQSPVGRHRRLPTSLSHRGRPRTLQSDGDTLASPNRLAGLAKTDQHMDTVTPKPRQAGRLQPNAQVAPSPSGTAARTASLSGHVPEPGCSARSTEAPQGGSPGAAVGDPPGAGPGRGSANQKGPGSGGAGHQAPDPSTPFKEAICGQRQRFDGPTARQREMGAVHGTQPDGQGVLLPNEHAAAGPQPLPHAVSAPKRVQGEDRSARQDVGGGPETFDGVQEDPHHPLRGSRDACTTRDERNAPLKGPERMFASQGIQTSQRLLDDWVPGLQFPGQPVERSIAVQTSQICAEVLAPQPPAQPRQSQQTGSLGPGGPEQGPLTESPPVSADEQPTSQAAQRNQVGTVVGVQVARSDGRQKGGKGCRQRVHESRLAACGPLAGGGVPAGTSGAAAAALSPVARTRPASTGKCTGPRPVNEDLVGAAMSTAAAPTTANCVTKAHVNVSGAAVQDAAADTGAAAPTEPILAAASIQETSMAAAGAAPYLQQQQQKAAGAHFVGSVTPAPQYGRLARRGIPLEEVQAWLGPGCAPLVAPSLTQDVLDVRNVAVGITSWPDVTMSVLGHLYSNPLQPLPAGPPQQAPVAGAAANSGAPWQDCWLGCHVPRNVQDVVELEGILPMARQVVGGPPTACEPAATPAAVVATLVDAMRLVAEHRADVAAAVAAVSTNGRADGDQEEPDMAARASSPGSKGLTDMAARGQQMPASKTGEVNAPQTMGVALDGRAARPAADFDFVLQSAPPDFFTQPF